MRHWEKRLDRGLTSVETVATFFVRAWRCWDLRRYWILFALLQVSLIIVSCGGGPAPATPDFSQAASPTTVTVFPSSGVSVSVSATAIDGFASQISVQVSGLPASVSATPATFTLTPGTSRTVILSAADSAPVGTTT